ncbi:MAG TPA: hypothetical protein VF226_15545 [Hyphomicrobiaceae bacterium]|jgi:hypothetical protein
MPVTFEHIEELKKRSEENKKAQPDQRTHLALELIADALILTLEQELDEDLADEVEEEEDEGDWEETEESAASDE